MIASAGKMGVIAPGIAIFLAVTPVGQVQDILGDVGNEEMVHKCKADFQ